MGNRITALIIEPEQTAAKYLETLLDQTCQVEVAGTASCGETGIRLCQELRPEAVFLDINLPGKDGVSLASQLTRIPPPPRIVFTTADPNRAVDAFRLDAVDYLLKPLAPNQVVEAVNRLQARPFIQIGRHAVVNERAIDLITHDGDRLYRVQLCDRPKTHINASRTGGVRLAAVTRALIRNANS